jgi:serine/threonine protein kinase
MELIGYDLEEIQQRVKNKKFTLKTVLMIALQTIDRLEALHSIGYIHRDIKPDNVAIGIKEQSKTIYLLDFGLVVKANAPIPVEEKNKVVGTLGFMSLRAHESKKATYWDDIECLIYTLVFLLEGTLPWMQIHAKNMADYNRVKILK